MSPVEPLRLFVGSYTASSGGRGLGVSVIDRTATDQPWRITRVVTGDDPSFLTLTEGALHAVSETNAGRVLSYTISAGDLVPASRAASGGAAPCHIVLDPASGALVVANYLGGTIGVLSADFSDPARVTRTLALPAGSGPVADRQEQPHAHNVVPTPDGTVLVSDLGTDRLHEVRIDPVTLEPSFVGVHSMPPGSGPRHFAWYGDRLLVTGELDGRMHVLRRDADSRFVVDHSVAAYDTTTPELGSPLLSHIAVAGEIVYVGVRGRDTITVLRPNADGRFGVVAEVSSGGAWPRHFAVADDALYVANQEADAVAVLPLDPATRIPGAVAVQLPVASPACVVFAQ